MEIEEDVTDNQSEVSENEDVLSEKTDSEGVLVTDEDIAGNEEHNGVDDDDITYSDEDISDSDDEITESESEQVEEEEEVADIDVEEILAYGAKCEEIMEKEDFSNLKSNRSVIPVALCYMNITLRHVDVLWVNYEGELEVYKVLPPRSRTDINTYKGHPWLFVDRLTHELMLGDLRRIFIPKSWFEYFQNIEPPTFNRRINLSVPRVTMKISIPMLSLKKIALHCVRKYIVKSMNDVDDLDIPKELKTDLKETFKPYTIQSLSKRK